MEVILQRVTERTCFHEFVFENPRKLPSCLGTHHISKCLYCKCNYHRLIYEIMPKNTCNNSISSLLFSAKENTNSKYYKTPLPHYHIWRSDGTCGSKLCFPDDENGNNYGYDIKENCRISNDNRICKCKRKKYFF